MDKDTILFLVIGINLILFVVLFMLFNKFNKMVEDSKNNEDSKLQEQLNQKEQEKIRLEEQNKNIIDTNSKLEKQIAALNISIQQKDDKFNKFNMINMNLDNKFNQLKPITSFLDQFQDIKRSGYIGEIILENILNSYGFRYDNDKSNDIGTFRTQEEIELGKRPDITLHISKDSYIVIDSKNINLNYDTTNLNDIKKSLLSQMDNLSKKNYNYMEKSLDFVIMFVPFDEVLTVLNIDQFNKNVIIATPSTIQPILYLLKNMLKEHKYTNFNTIEKELTSIYNMLVDSLNTFSSLRTNIKKVDKDLDKLYTTLEGIDDIFKVFETLKQIGNINTKKKLNKNV